MSKKNKFSQGVSSHAKKRGTARREGKRILIFTEGILTEPQYFENLQRLDDFNNIQITTDPRPPQKGGKPKQISRGSDPMSVVRDCIKKKVKHDFAAYFCIVDVDQYHNTTKKGELSTLEKAINTAKSEGISLAVSNKSFEFWLECHYERSKDLCMKDKNIPEDFPYDQYKSACKKADQRAENSTGKIVELNEIGPYPSTSLPRIIKKIIDISNA